MEKIKLDKALEAATALVKLVEKDEYPGDPISVTISGEHGQPIVTLMMDGSMPISVSLSVKKAYTAWVTKMETIEWEKQKIDPSNIGDSNITCFGGGVPVFSGAIGVSGRSSYSKNGKTIEDHELAKATAAAIKELIKGRVLMTPINRIRTELDILLDKNR